MDVVLIAALSLDGRITRGATPGTAFTSAEDGFFLRALLANCDASIMGAGTYRLFRDSILGAKPAGRRRLIWTRAPEPMRQAENTAEVEFTNETPPRIVAELASEGRRRCALMGGTETYNAFLQAGAVTELWLTYEPWLFGTGKPLFSGDLASRWDWCETRALNAATFAHHYRKAHD